MPNRAPSPRSVRAGAAGVVLALALLPWLAVASARAATLEVPQRAGLTEPGGLAEAPDCVSWKLRPGQLRGLRPGRHLLQVQAGPTRSRLGTKRLERPIVLAREAR